MADKGIIFSAPMVRALLDGRKTQTRRLIKPPMKPEVNPSFSGLRALVHGNGRWMIHGSQEASDPFKVPYTPGDRLYVREAAWIAPPGWTNSPVNPMGPNRQEVAYKADDHSGYTASAAADYKLRLRPSIHMPRWASRMWLAVTDVRVQRLQEISREDCLAEGHPTKWDISPDREVHLDAARDWFMDLWNSLHTAEGERWEDNPWIVAVSFDVRKGNIDEAQP